MYKFESSHAILNAVYDAFSIDMGPKGLSFYGKFTVVRNPNEDPEAILDVEFKGTPVMETIEHFKSQPWDIFHRLPLTVTVSGNKPAAELAMRGLIMIMEAKLASIHWIAAEK